MRIITKLNHSDPLTVPVASVLGWGLRVYYVEQVGSAFIIEIAGGAISLSSMRQLHADIIQHQIPMYKFTKLHDLYSSERAPTMSFAYMNDDELAEYTLENSSLFTVSKKDGVTIHKGCDAYMRLIYSKQTVNYEHDDVEVETGLIV